ncbi:3-oxoacyl-ACP synthase III family protein [Micromonospora sp. DT233]|uniref:3-oxoacyl-ACP synthase III family protein n=1 Tax=Micromonospora sp. DT233 TaxID=3393432 RepID=UPI003CED343C
MAEPTVHVTGVGTALPGPPVDNATLADRLGLDARWIDTFIGTRTRHFAVDLASGQQVATLADLAEAAAAEAMRRADVIATEIDFVVLATASPDELMPATVNRVADLLGVDRVPTYQLQSGCAGAVQALDVGRLLLGRAEHRTGLVIGGDVCARHLRLDRDFRRAPSAELVNYVLFGDGAGAAVLSADDRPGAPALREVRHQVTGLRQPPGQVVRWFGEADRGTEVRGFEEDYKAIEERVPDLAEQALWQLLDATGWRPEDLTYLLPPQLSGRMTRLIAERLGVPDAEEISCVEETGNNGNALPFLQLERLVGRMRGGERAVAVCVEASKWIMGGFALEGR